MTFKKHVQLTPQAVKDTFLFEHKFKVLPKNTRRIHIVGSGSSYSQAIYLTQLINNYLPYTAVYHNPYSFVRYCNPNSNDVFIHFTQEAKRLDNKCPIKHALKKKMKTILFSAQDEHNLPANINEVYWYAPEIEKILVASMSYSSGYAVALKFVNFQLSYLKLKPIPWNVNDIFSKMIKALNSEPIIKNNFSVFLYAGYAKSVAIEGALKVNECMLQDSESYELKHYSHGKHFVSWNKDRTFNVLSHKKDADLIKVYNKTIFEKHHQINLMQSNLEPEIAVFEWTMQMLVYITIGMEKLKIELTDIPVRDTIRIPHQFEY